MPRIMSRLLPVQIVWFAQFALPISASRERHHLIRGVGVSGCRGVGVSGCRGVGVSLFQLSRTVVPTCGSRPLGEFTAALRAHRCGPRFTARCPPGLGYRLIANLAGRYVNNQFGQLVCIPRTRNVATLNQSLLGASRSEAYQPCFGRCREQRHWMTVLYRHTTPDFKLSTHVVKNVFIGGFPYSVSVPLDGSRSISRWPRSPGAGRAAALFRRPPRSLRSLHSVNVIAAVAYPTPLSHPPTLDFQKTMLAQQDHLIVSRTDRGGLTNPDG